MRWIKKAKKSSICQLKYRCSQINITAVLVSGIVLLLAGMLVRAVCGSPYHSAVLLYVQGVIPPPWLMTLFWMIWYFLLGGIFGAIMFSGPFCGVICFQSVEKYRGGMFFIAMIFLGFLWYPLFFVAARLFLCAVLLLLILGLCVLTGISFFKVSKWAGSFLFVHALFLIWMLILSIKVLLCS